MTGGQVALVHPWDAELSLDEIRRLRPSHRRARTIVAFTRKVELLEAWVVSGVPDGMVVPKDRTSLRRWCDADAGLWAWSDRQVDDPDGRNQDLVQRYDRCRRLLLARKRRVDPMTKLAGKEEIIRRLEQQNLQLLSQVRNLQDLLAKSGVEIR